MVDIQQSPPREGTRGGLEQFQWEQVTTQSYRDRECYLGHSTKVGIPGRGGQFFKHDWWSSKQSQFSLHEQEAEISRRYEEELMQEALGIRPKRLLLIKNRPTVQKMKELLEEGKKPELIDPTTKKKASVSPNKSAEQNIKKENFKEEKKNKSKPWAFQTDLQDPGLSAISLKRHKEYIKKQKAHDSRKPFKRRRSLSCDSISTSYKRGVSRSHGSTFHHHSEHSSYKHLQHKRHKHHSKYTSPEYKRHSKRDPESSYSHRAKRN